MRKFNLKGTVVERMKGIPREEPKPSDTASTLKDTVPEMSAAFTEQQGVFAVAWRTDVGRLRKNNQDAVILGNGLAGVADGMGGHKGGEIASAGLRDGLLRETRERKPDLETLREAVRTVNRELWEQQEKDISLTGMGTTLTIAWPTEKEMIIGQVGDSRAYLLRDGEMKQVTEDHSMVADMVRKGVLTEEQAACHPMRNYITRAVGTDEILDVDIVCEKRHTGDRWLVCSDGLYGLMGKSVMAELAAIPDAEEAARQLMQTALNNGGKDNISLVLVDDTAEHAEDPDPVRPPETDEPSGEVADA
jgi:protein phosphatase